MKFGQLLFRPAGRIGRGAFWFGMLSLMIAAVPIVLALRAGVTAAAALSLAVLYVLVCLSAKRLRDIGHTPWLQLLPWVLAVVPVLGETLLWSGRQATGLGAIAGPLVLSINPRMLVWFEIVFLVWLGLSRPKTAEARPQKG